MKGDDEMKKLVVHLCDGCIEELNEYNPYLYPIKVVKVAVQDCDNYEENLGKTNWGFVEE